MYLKRGLGINTILATSKPAWGCSNPDQDST